LRASNMAVGEPAQRAPTTMASYMMNYLCCADLIQLSISWHGPSITYQVRQSGKEER
jgi:hypothetical protein